jgi:hypothetical protein
MKFFEQLESANNFWHIDNFRNIFDYSQYTLFKNGELSELYFDGQRKLMFDGNEIKDFSDYYLYGYSDDNVFQQTIHLFRSKNDYFEYKSYEKDNRNASFAWLVWITN